MPPEYVYKRARDFDWTVYLEDTAPQKRVANAFVTQFDDFRREAVGKFSEHSTLAQQDMQNLSIRSQH